MTERLHIAHSLGKFSRALKRGNGASKARRLLKRERREKTLRLKFARRKEAEPFRSRVAENALELKELFWESEANDEAEREIESWDNDTPNWSDDSWDNDTPNWSDDSWDEWD